MFVVVVTLAPCKPYCYSLLIQNGEVYVAAELPCKNIGQVSPLQI